MIDLDVPDVTGGTDPTRLTFPSSTTSSRASSTTVTSAIAASTAPGASPSVVQVTSNSNATNKAAIAIGAVLGVCVIVLGAVVVRMWMRSKETKTVEQQPDMRTWPVADRTAGTGSTSPYPSPSPYQGYPEV